MEISTGQSTEVTKASLLDQLNSIADKNSSEYRSKVRELEVVLGIKEVNVLVQLIVKFSKKTSTLCRSYNFKILRENLR